MIFEMHQPQKGCCGNMIYYQGFMPRHKIERVVPDGCIYLIFELDGFTRYVFDNDSLEPIHNFTECWISFSQADYLSISAHENSEMFVLQFMPGNAALIIDGDLNRFANQVVPAEQVIRQTAELRTALLSVGTAAEKFELAEKWLIEMQRGPDATDTVIANLVTAIQENSTSRLKDLVEASGYSQKQIIHHFKRRVGLTPKAYQRIVRFNEILPMIMENQSVSWQKISIECDYFDQSHFIKEFKRFSGYSPSEFLTTQKDHANTNFFPLTD